MFELHLRQFLQKTVSRCQRKCGKKITQDDGMLIKTYGNTRWTDKKVGKQMSKHGPMYKTSLKRQTKKYYGQTKDTFIPLLQWLMKHIIYQMKKIIF